MGRIAQRLAKQRAHIVAVQQLLRGHSAELVEPALLETLEIESGVPLLLFVLFE
jgi:hypothetical protein